MVDASDLLDRIERLSCELGQAKAAANDDAFRLVRLERDDARRELERERARGQHTRAVEQKIEEGHELVDRAASMLEQIARLGFTDTDLLERIRAEGFLEKLRKLEKDIDPIPF